MDILREWIIAQTDGLSNGGRQVVVAYSTSPGDSKAVRVLLTSTRFYGRVMGDLRNSYPELVFHLGRTVDPKLLEKVIVDRSDCQLVTLTHPSLDWTNVEHRVLVRDHLARRSPSSWASRGVALLDICGFSKMPAPSQVSLRMMLDLALTQARTRLAKNLPPGTVVSFHRVSSGDGYYVWNRIPGPYADALTFALLALVLAHIRGREREWTDLQLRAVFTVGEMYTIPYQGVWADGVSDEPVEDAIGPALNIAARLSAAAIPDQLIVGDFRIPGNQHEGQYVDPRSLLAFVKALFPDPGTRLELTIQPEATLRVVDKQGATYHCYNVHGRGFYFTGQTPRQHEIGVAEDPALPLTSFAFRRLGS